MDKEALSFPKSPCSCMVYTLALQGLPSHGFGAHVHTVNLHGAFGTVLDIGMIIKLGARQSKRPYIYLELGCPFFS